MSSLHRTNKYDDMIDLPHHVSKTHPPMDIMDRAAAEETRRLTQPKIELDESEKELLDIRLHDLETQFSQRPEITITYFIPDTKKEGGAYHTFTGNITKIDHTRRSLILANVEIIPIENVYDIQF